jgi:hypothetical protein
MPRSRSATLTTIRTEGALLPADFLQRLAEGSRDVPGLTPEAYHLAGTERLHEAISRSWNRLLGVWAAFQATTKDLAATDPGIGVTREKWLLPLFQELGYGRLLAARTFEVGGKAYPISHAWQHTPIHLVGRNVDLDRRSPGVAGAAKVSPHGLVQEFLNRSDEHLWGILANGLKLRLLRESKSLTRQAYVECDLAGMMEGQAYADFALLWLLCHQSRVETERPTGCWLERWAEAARAQGTRALETLREGVEQAIAALGRGLLAHPANATLLQRLRSGALSGQEYYRQLLRVVYRLIFLFVAEERDLLLTAQPGSRERKRYADYYSMGRLRRLAEHRRGTPHADLWQGFSLVVQKLSSDTGCPELGLPGLGSYLWSAKAAPDLDGCALSNADFLASIRALAFTIEGKVRRAIDYRNLGAEELGSVYESLLELHPDVNVDAGTFALRTAAGHERKTTGSYYTPTSLVECLLDTALDPVLAEAAKQPDPEKAILHLKVCDPACGSGHFLIAAAHRIANRLAAIRTGDEEPSPDSVRKALRDVIGHCIYGVDVNPMAVELCKVNLWLEALEPGKPLSFLEHRIQCGNSLLGATPALLKNGIPDDAFEPIEGDDKKTCQKFKKENKKERTGQMRLIDHKLEPWQRLGNLATAIVELDAIADDTVQGQQAKQAKWEQLVRSSGYEFGRLLADAWCAAFVWKKASDPLLQYPITEDTFRRIERNPHWIPGWMRDEVRRLAAEHSFFHWHLAFPDVFRALTDEEGAKDGPGWLGGFDVVLGNPPWERVKLQEKEFFAERRPDIANAPNAAARGKLIKALAQDDPPLFRAFRDAVRQSEGESALVRETGRYPLCGRGDVNTYSIFAELNRSLVAYRGRAGFLVPSGIATDDTTKHFFDTLVTTGSLVSLYSFFETRRVFLDTDSRNPFCLLTLRGEPTSSRRDMEFAFDLRSVGELLSADRRFSLTAKDIALLNPNTRTCPIFRTRQDAELTKAIYRRVPVLINEAAGETGNPWGIRFLAMLHMANDSGLFRTAEKLEIDGWKREGSVYHRDGARYLPLYEAKMVHHYNHRFGDYAHKPEDSESTALPDVPDALLADPAYAPLPRYWVPEAEVEDRLEKRDRDGNLVWRWDRGWFIGWRDICRSTDERTVIASVIPRVGVNHKFPLSLPSASHLQTAAFIANLSAHVFDYVTRQKLGGTSLTYFVLKQFPLLPPSAFNGLVAWDKGFTLDGWLSTRVLELAYTAWDLQPFAEDLGWDGPPFRWDPDRRFKLRCELDAAFFRLYLPATPSDEWRIASKAEGSPYDETPEELAELKRHFPAPRDAVAYIMDTFPIVRRKDEEKWGEYRTKRVILEIYDAMAEAIRTGHPYQTRLDPPPADPRCCHPQEEEGRASFQSARGLTPSDAHFRGRTRR